MPPISPTSSAQQAVDLLDKNGDGLLDESELADSPGIRAALGRYDTDGDGKVSSEEIAARLTSLVAAGSPWVSVDCQIFFDGRPLTDAQVRFVPAPFLKDALRPASGTTNRQGRVQPAVADEALPEDKKGLHIMQPGLYQVEVEHPKIQQPHKPLGCEIDVVARGGTSPVFNL